MNAPSLRLAGGRLSLIRILRRDLVERGVRHLVAVYLRRPLDQPLQRLQDGGIGITTVGLRVLFLIPQADRDGFGAIGSEKGNLVLEAGLLAQHRQDFVLERAGEIGAFVGLEMQRDVACVHRSSFTAFSMNIASLTLPTGTIYRTVLTLSSYANSVSTY